MFYWYSKYVEFEWFLNYLYMYEKINLFNPIQPIILHPHSLWNHLISIYVNPPLVAITPGEPFSHYHQGILILID
jgi:hypothetical protein